MNRVNNACCYLFMLFCLFYIPAEAKDKNNENESSSIGAFLTDWKIYIPFYIAYGRWGLYLLLRVMPALCYRQIKYIKPTPAQLSQETHLDTKDFTVIVAVYEPPPGFEAAIRSIVSNKPGRIFVVADVSCINITRTICNQFPTVEVIQEDKPGKRAALITGLKLTTTKLIAFVDDDIIWSETFLEKLIAPFQKFPEVGGVGCKQVGRINGFFDVIGIMADMRLAVRSIELMATTRLDKGCACISGRTAAYRTEIIQKEKFYDYFVNEKFFGMQLQSGDDKCLTRFIINEGYKTYHQLRKSCMLSTSFERGCRFNRQMLRWARNTWRSDIKALFLEKRIWHVTPITAFILLDKMFTPFFMLYGVTYLPTYAIMHKQYVAILAWYLWLIATRTIKLFPYLTDHPQYFIYVPIFVIFQYYTAFLRVWALLSLPKTNWGTRSIAIVNGVVVRKGEQKSEHKDELKEEKNTDLGSNPVDEKKVNDTTEPEIIGSGNVILRIHGD